MEIDLTTNIYDYFNKPIFLDDKQIPATAKDFLISALMNCKEESSTDKLKNFVLSSKIAVSDKIEMDSSDIDFILKRVGEVSHAVIYGQLYNLLNKKV